MKLDIKKFFINYDRIVFETRTNSSNVDVIANQDSFNTAHVGTIRHIKSNSVNIGEFTINIIHTELAQRLDRSVKDVIDPFNYACFYDDLITLSDKINLMSYKKLIIVNDLVIKKEYRKKEILLEFMRYLYKNFYNDDYFILFHTMPFQYNELICELYYNFNHIDQDTNRIGIKIFDHYELDEFVKADDKELSTYKLYAHMRKHGCKFINSTNFFEFNTDYIIKSFDYM